MTNGSRLRIRLPSGAELEAEGSPEFIAEERKRFEALTAPPARAAAPGGEAGEEAVEPAWETLLEARGGLLQLRTKLPSSDPREAAGAAKDACLVLLAAARSLLRVPKPTAAQLAKWLRSSGYPVGRVDRAIAAGVERGEILSSGSRRARRYELSGPGLAKAYRLAKELERFIAPRGPAS